jgi:transcription initiation factor TFIIB
MHRSDVYERRYDESTEQTAANTCPECGGRVTMTTAETVCDDCGLVLADSHVDLGAEWREFEDTDEQRRRTGARRTPARHDRGLSTQIGHGTDATGRRVSDRKRRQLRRFRREQRRAKIGSKAERNQVYGLTQIRRMAGALGLGQLLRNRACQLFRTAQQADLLVGRSVEAIAGAAIYLACRCNETPRQLSEVASVSQVSQESLRNGETVLRRELDLPVPPVRAEQYLDAIASEVGLPHAVRHEATEHIEQLREAGYTNGSHPAGVAAGSLYRAAEENEVPVTQARLADVADVSAVTIRSRYQELKHLR